MENLSSYFMKEQEYYLDSISYERIDQIIGTTEVQMLCTDTVEAKEIEGEKVIINVTRKVSFSPEILFDLSISYGAILKFNDNKRDVDWTSIDLSGEFKENGSFVTDNLFRRISLLVGEITSSFGQPPIIIPPQIIIGNK